MLKPVLIVFVLIWLITFPAFAIGHAEVLYPGEKAYSYFAMASTAYAYHASAITLDYGLEKNLTAEIFVLGDRSLAVYSNSYNQIALHMKQQLIDFNWSKIIAVYGFGALWNSGNGASTSFDLGAMAVVPFGDYFRFSSPVVAAVFRDGVLVDYSAGFSFCPWGLSCDSGLLVGVKGTQMNYLNNNQVRSNSSVYGVVGWRLLIDQFS